MGGKKIMDEWMDGWEIHVHPRFSVIGVCSSNAVGNKCRVPRVVDHYTLTLRALTSGPFYTRFFHRTLPILTPEVMYCP